MFIAMVCWPAMINAQSTSSSSPTPLTSSFSGTGPNQETDYYFSASRGPGQVTITLKLAAKQYSTFARLEATNGGGNTLATLNMNATSSTGPAEETRSFSLATKQTIRVKLTLDNNLDSYTLSISGGGGVGMVGRTTSTDPNPALSNTESGIRPSGISSLGRPTVGKNPQGGLGTASGDSGAPRRNVITFECPATLVATIQLPPGWSAPFGSQLKKQRIEAAVLNNQITCRYGESLEEALIRPVPKGYTCQTYDSGGRPRLVQCKPIGAGIKISK